MHALRLTLLFGLAAISTSAFAAKVNEPAPNFKVQDTLGKTHARDDYKGKYVVLEWHNRECPYVKKHYESGNMQSLQKEWTQKGVVWLTVLSSAPGKPGFLDATAANAEVTKQNALPTAVILDTKGELARQFAAKTTPHMFIVGPDSKLIYAGAIDDKPMGEAADVAKAHNYVAAALGEAMAGKAVAQAATTPYGCGVKY